MAPRHINTNSKYLDIIIEILIKMLINKNNSKYLDSGHVLREALVLLADLERQLSGVTHDDDRDLEQKVSSFYSIGYKIVFKSFH